MIRSRILVMILALLGLALIVPDLVRVVQPLGSLGFYADNDGLIYSVSGPFEDRAASPAWQAGLRVGDRLDLDRLSCSLRDVDSCSGALTVLGGLEFVLPGKEITLPVAATSSAPARNVTLVAAQRPANFLVRAVNLLCQIAGIAVVIAAAWLVWSRPSAMSWGFFLYVNWFNPGQEYAFYAILQQWPAALLVQNIASCLAEGAAYAGFLLFVLRVPNNTTEPRWRPIERALPLIGAVFSLVMLASYASVFGYPSETITRAGILFGFVVDLCALGILLARRSTQGPEDYQRVRWVIWGCLIGLPSFLIAELASETTFFRTTFTGFALSEDVIGLLYLVNGILCLFVFEALRRERVVSVAIPLRRVTRASAFRAVSICRAGVGSRSAPPPCTLSAGCMSGRCVPWTAISTAISMRPSASLVRRSNRPRGRPRSTGCWRMRPQTRSRSPPPPRSASEAAPTSGMRTAKAGTTA